MLRRTWTRAPEQLKLEGLTVTVLLESEVGDGRGAGVGDAVFDGVFDARGDAVGVEAEDELSDVTRVKDPWARTWPPESRRVSVWMPAPIEHSEGAVLVWYHVPSGCFVRP